jgi:hypothetical protein
VEAAHRRRENERLLREEEETDRHFQNLAAERALAEAERLAANPEVSPTTSEVAYEKEQDQQQYMKNMGYFVFVTWRAFLDKVLLKSN